jgi:hypothetical protein
MNLSRLIEIRFLMDSDIKKAKQLMTNLINEYDKEIIK